MNFNNNVKKCALELSKLIKNKNLSLFFGAGITGTSWDTLVKSVTTNKNNIEYTFYQKLQYKYNNCEKNSFYANVYNTINIANYSKKTDEYLNKLFSYNEIKNVWTTNYDKHIDHLLNKYFTKIVINEKDLIFHENDFDKILYKINGDITDLENSVITLEQYEKHQERTNFFKTFFEKELFSKSILFIGYSFSDDVVLRTIAKLNNYFNNLTNCCYTIVSKEEYNKKNEFYCDLNKRYRIKPIILDNYEYIKDFIDLVDYYYRSNNIYISGSLNLDKNRKNIAVINNLKSFFEQLFESGYKLYSNHGEFIGYHLGATATKFAKINKTVPNRYLEMNPIYEDDNQKKYRQDMISKTKFSVFVYGEQKSTGMIEEFKLSINNSNLIFPFPNTGKTPSIIFNFIMQNLSLFKELNEIGSDFAELQNVEWHNCIKVILKILAYFKNKDYYFERTPDETERIIDKFNEYLSKDN